MNSSAEWALTEGRGNHQKAFPRDLTVNRSHAKQRGHPRPEEGRLCVCLLESQGPSQGAQGLSQKEDIAEVTKSWGGASLGLKTPREVQGTWHSRPQRCDPHLSGTSTAWWVRDFPWGNGTVCY